MPNKVKSPSETDEISEILSEDQTNETQEVETDASKGSGQGETQTEAKLKIGEEEFDPAEAARLISKAREVETIEKEQNVDVAKLYPDYTKKSQLLRDPVQLGAYIAKEFGQEKVPTPENQVVTDAVREAKEKYGMIFKDDLESFKESFKQELEVDQLLGDAREIEKESGIKVSDLLDYMKVAKVDDPYEAAEKIKRYQEISAGKPEPTKPTFTEKSGSSGTHVPQGKKLPHADDTTALREVITDMMNEPTPEEAE